MSLAALFLSAEGRLSRKPFWLGVLALLVAVALANVAALLFDAKGVEATPAAQWYRVGSFVVIAALAWPSYALIAKRMHDRGQDARAAIAYSALTLALHGADAIYPLETAKGELLWPGLVIGAPLVLVVLALIIEGVRRGQAGANAYGPDPLEAQSA
jgi:uncharacterized membrane protein YhaH (DUF805 family)